MEFCVHTLFFFLLRAITAAYGNSWPRGWIITATATLCHSHSNTGSEWAVSATYTAACANAWSLTHWAKPGTKPASSGTLCCVFNPLSHNGNSSNINIWLSYAICVCSLVSFLFRSFVHFLAELFVYCWDLRVFFVFWTHVHYKICFENIFSKATAIF